MRPPKLPRTVGGFTVNVCRNATCSSFAVPPVLPSQDPANSTGGLRDAGENRSYLCKSCGKQSRIKSNTALVEEYARLRSVNRGTKRQHCPNAECASYGVPIKLMPSAYRAHGKTPKGDQRYQCKSCRKTFSIGKSKRRHRETTETSAILKLLVNNVPLRRILEITDIPSSRLYSRIDYLADQCRLMSGHKDRKLWDGFVGRNKVLSTDVQMILANWRNSDQINTVPVLHAVTVERDSSYVVAATTDFDPEIDPSEIEAQMQSDGDFDLPRAWRKQARVWSYEEYADSILRGVYGKLSEEEARLANENFDLPGYGSRIRADIFQAAHMMLVRKLIGHEFRQVLYCIDGDTGLAALTCAFAAGDIRDGRVHVADIRFSKGLGNRKREDLVADGEDLLEADRSSFAALMDIATNAYGLRSEMTALVAARLLSDYGLAPTSARGASLAGDGYDWRYHRKEEPRKHIKLLTDRGDLSFGELALLLTRASMAPVDKYFAQARRRVKAFDRGSRPTSGDGSWYVNAFYDPYMIDKVATILRFYHNFMLPESADTGIPKAERRTPAMKVGVAKGFVYMRDLLSF